MATFDLRQYAQAGAKARLVELVAEADRIRRAFPGVDADVTGAVRGKGAARQQRDAAPRGRRSTTTAAERKAVSARMKAYWGARREAKVAEAAPQQAEPPEGATKPSAVKRGRRKGGTKKR